MGVPNRAGRWTSIALAATLATSAAGAQVVIAGNFGPGDSYQTGTGNAWATGGLGTDPSGAPFGGSGNAVSFTLAPGASMTFDGFRFAAHWWDGDNQVYMRLYEGPDLNGATLLEPFLFSTGAQKVDQIFVGTSTLHPVLTPGNTYWLALEVPNPEAGQWGWQWNDVGQVGYEARFYPGPWFAEGPPALTPVFEVTASPISPALVPEPASLTLVAMGLATVGFRRRRRG